MLKIDTSIIWVIVNLLIFYFLIRKFLFQRILDMIEKRKQLIDGQFADAAARKQEAIDMKEKYEDSLKNAKEESRQIVEAAKLRGEQEYNQILQNAKDESERLIAHTNESLERQQEKAMQEIRDQIGDLAMSAAEKILGEKVSADTDMALYDEFLKKAGEQDDTDCN